MKYKSVVQTKIGSPEVLQVMENDLREPAAGEARIKILATTVGGTDLAYRTRATALTPHVPFVPGYEIVGVIDALGSGVKNFTVGDRVAALIGHGGYAEYINLAQQHLVPVPSSLDVATAVTLVLNYVTAYQILHREAKVKSGQQVLVIGASGGVGLALLELGRLAGLKMYGTASPSKHGLITSLGATPIDYHDPNWVEVIRKAVPEGFDSAFDGVGGNYYFDRCFGLLREGGKLVEYAIARGGWGGLLGGLAKIAWLNLLPNGRGVSFYGITAVYSTNKKPFMEDLPILFKMLADGQIKPVIAEKLPLLDAARGQILLESGKVSGNIVLLAPELL
jgi:NADPH:quinone reductase-like Zn-dependent oxidoreductase